MVDIQSPTAEIRRGKKKEERRRKKKKETTRQKYNGLPYSIGRMGGMHNKQQRARWPLICC